MKESLFEGNIKGEHIFIRSVKGGDTQLLLDFINTLSAEQTYIMYQGRQLTYGEEERYIQDFIEKVNTGNAVKLLAFCGESLVGVADVTRMTTETEPHIGTFGITISKEWRGKGIGSVLMDKTLEEVQNKMTGIRMVKLGVFGNNPVAYAMYKKKGFIEYGNLKQGLLHKGQFVDHLFMYKLMI